MMLSPSEIRSSIARAYAAAATSAAPLSTTGFKPEGNVGFEVHILGAAQNAETYTISLIKGTDSSLTSPTTIRSIGLTAHATNNDDTSFMLDFMLDKDFDADKPFVGVTVTPSSTGGTAVFIEAQGFQHRYGPAADRNNGAHVGSASATPTNGIQRA